ncbi:MULTISPECIES: hypothetical protein [unclassified Rickettsia]
MPHSLRSLAMTLKGIRATMPHGNDIKKYKNDILVTRSKTI